MPLTGAVRFVAALLLAAALAVVAILCAGRFVPMAADPAFLPPLTAEKMKEQVEVGRYLARVADCVACHTAEGGAPLGGGRPFALPVGVIFSSNISSDPETGIGRWSRADFHRAVRDGVAPHGRLYPAMPYASYRGLRPEDVDAIWSWLMSRPPIRQPNRAGNLPTELGRLALGAWNLLYLPPPGERPDPTRSDSWNRGRYLVDALGHCGECHTPRNALLAMMPSRYLAGARIESVDAPDITPAGLERMQFDAVSLARYLPAGVGPQGVMNFSMYDVVHNSTRHLTARDSAAMAAYLVASRESSPARQSTAEAAAMELRPGRQTYLDLCAACHGVDGEGIAHVAPAMNGNASLRIASAHNLLVAIAGGFPDRQLPGDERFQSMPAFGSMLDDDAMAVLATYLRATWGAGSTRVTPEEARRARAALR